MTRACQSSRSCCQLREAFPEAAARRYLVHDRDHACADS